MREPETKPRVARTILLAALLALWPTAGTARGSVADSFGGREMIVHVPDSLPPAGARALVIVLHGGLGNADRIANRQSESGLNMDAVAETHGFIVAYLNGTPVTRFLGKKMLGWNAGGGCCGQPARTGVDDVAYIEGAAAYLAGKYGVDRARIFGTGHSNGAVMTQRLMCETTLYAAAVTFSGPLGADTDRCPAAKGRRILAIHGADDRNVPVAGGRGTKGLSGVAFGSEEHARKVFTDSGATYTLQIVPEADHALDHIGAAIQANEGISIAEKAARFFGIGASDAAMRHGN
jgi:polyhydroxybutyrate depolymerase